MFVNSYGTLPTPASSGAYSYALALSVSPEPACLPEACAASCQDQYSGSLPQPCDWSPAPVCAEPPASPRPPREPKAGGKKKACKHKMKKKNMRMRTLETNSGASIMNSGSEGGNRGESMGGMGGGSTGGCPSSGDTGSKS